MDCHRHRLQHSCLFKGYIVRQFYQVLCRHSHILRKAPVPAGAQITVIPAHFILSLYTRPASPAGNHREHAYPLPQPGGIRLFPHRLHHAGEFMPRNQRMPVSPRPVNPWDIWTANARSLYRHKRLAAFQGGQLHCFQPYLIYAVQDPCFHLFMTPLWISCCVYFCLPPTDILYADRISFCAWLFRGCHRFDAVSMPGTAFCNHLFRQIYGVPESVKSKLVWLPLNPYFTRFPRVRAPHNTAQIQNFKPI